MCSVELWFVYTAQFLVTMTSSTAGYVFKKIIGNLENYAPRSELRQGSLKLSFIVVLVVGVQLLMTVSISRAVIFLLLMTSGDIERNPGPEQTVTSRYNSSSFAFWLSAQSFCDKFIIQYHSRFISSSLLTQNSFVCYLNATIFSFR